MAYTPNYLGQYLIDQGLITKEDLDKALARQKRVGGKLGENLVSMNLLSEEQLMRILQKQKGVTILQDLPFKPDPEKIKSTPPEIVQKYKAAIIREEPTRVYVITPDPLNFSTMDELSFYFQKKVIPVFVTEREFIGMVGTVFGEQMEITESEVHQVLENIVRKASEAKASDIHIEPHPTRAVVRYRIEGILKDQPLRIPPAMAKQLINRIKVLSGLDITNHHLPQDGQWIFQNGMTQIPLRVSTFPTEYGEKVVIRLLMGQHNFKKLDQLGMPDEMLYHFRKIIHHLQGVVLVTGPTGSGKTTTLYSALDELNTPDKNICTLEDPIEVRLSGIIQSNINEKQGYTFAKGLRALLRQDPDIILVGEIRDPETAQVAMQAALTGHLILSTLHTLDAPGAIYRLQEMDISREILAQALNGIVNQRLVKTLCPECKAPVPKESLPPELRVLAEAFQMDTWEAKGCSACGGSGYQGRKALFEILVVDDDVRHHLRDPQVTDFTPFVQYPMWQQGLSLVKQGYISLRELVAEVRMPTKVEKMVSEKRMKVLSAGGMR